ncbi:hypothetical protein BGX29_003551 [Mortierella sp. GBA35]|nr:hypothetical protein BGX29_003551 [Mortierella sp. GBA35]
MFKSLIALLALSVAVVLMLVSAAPYHPAPYHPSSGPIVNPLTTIAPQTDFIPITNVQPIVNVLPTDYNDYSWDSPYPYYDGYGGGYGDAYGGFGGWGGYPWK